ncbi:hypothetical protein L9F63_016632, partial [Diploptera punctata]
SEVKKVFTPIILVYLEGFSDCISQQRQPDKRKRTQYMQPPLPDLQNIPMSNFVNGAGFEVVKN